MTIGNYNKLPITGNSWHMVHSMNICSDLFDLIFPISTTVISAYHGPFMLTCTKQHVAATFPSIHTVIVAVVSPT